MGRGVVPGDLELLGAAVFGAGNDSGGSPAIDSAPKLGKEVSGALRIGTNAPQLSLRRGVSGGYVSRPRAKRKHLGAGLGLNVPDSKAKNDGPIVSQVELNAAYVRRCLCRLSRRGAGREQ
jgi:hypothetical protein